MTGLVLYCSAIITTLVLRLYLYLYDIWLLKMVNRAAQKLRAQLAQPDFIAVCPGVYDGLTARTLLQQGFEHLYMVGSGPFLE